MYSDNPRGSVILLSACPQEKEQGLIQYLHAGLIDKGWNSVLISLRDTPLEQHATLIQTSRKQALEQVNAPVILLADNCHNDTVLSYASQPNNSLFTAYITLGMQQKAGQYPQHLNAPLLDVQGTANRSDVISPVKWLATLRLAKGKRMELPTATHNFTAQEDKLLFLISQWLRSIS